MLTFLWRQWSTLGAPGYSDGDDPRIIDPEALLLFSLTVSRYDARLFDEIMDWLARHGDYINIQHLKRMQAEEFFSAQQLLSAVAAVMAEQGKASKWGRLAAVAPVLEKPENLFYSQDGLPIAHFGATDPVFAKYGFLRPPWRARDHTLAVQIMKHSGLLFRLRALFGNNARADIILYLLTHKTGHPRRIARECYYFQKTVQDALVEMAASGIVRVQSRGKEKHYQLAREDWFQLLQITEPAPIWLNWPLLFSALEKIWAKLSDQEFVNLDELLQSSELRQLMKIIRPKIELSGLGLLLADDSIYLGKDYLKVFVQDISDLIEKLVNAQSIVKKRYSIGFSE
ncbi:MAG TPA: hypothetical protein PLP19_14695 [bacterium]|nr:hypothetical protein [bacterium]HPN44738.1 hypothetical protein [bacterium]